MHHIDHNPEFSESSSSSPEATPPDRQQETSRSAYTSPESKPFDHNQEISELHHSASGEDPFSSTNSSQTPTKRRSFWKASYLAVVSAIVAALIIGGLGEWLLGQHQYGGQSTDPSNPTQQAQIEKVVEKFHTAVIQINVQKSPTELSIGSGVLIDPRGYIVTNNHVVEGGQKINVTLYDGSSLPAQLTGTDPADDLAVIHITAPKNIAVAPLVQN